MTASAFKLISIPLLNWKASTGHAETAHHLSYCLEASICPLKPVPTSSSCIFTHRVREVLLCFEQCGSLLMTSQLSSGRSWCQNGQEDEESSAYYTGTATAASPGSHEYLDNCWHRLMCTPISDSYLTPLVGLATGPCQAALGFQLLPVCLYFSLLKACLLSAPQSCSCILEALLCSFHATAMDRMKGYWWETMKVFLRARDDRAWKRKNQQERREGWPVWREKFPVLLFNHTPSRCMGIKFMMEIETKWELTCHNRPFSLKTLWHVTERRRFK